jgi:hypothetical protein
MWEQQLNTVCCTCTCTWQLNLCYCLSNVGCAVSEVELTRPENRVKSLHVDPRGAHVLACVKTANNYELLYVHSSWNKPRQLSKLKGLPVTAVGWQKQPSSEEEAEQQQQQQRPGSGSSRSKGAAKGEADEDDELLLSTG